MHYHCEVIIPPTDDVEAAVASIMEPFDENSEDEDGYTSPHTFWDWYQIGGRFSGSRAQAALNRDRINAFVAELQRRKVTVSGVQWGKQELQPVSQIPDVDALWQEWFPESGMSRCPLFKHAGDTLAGDIATMAETPGSLTAARIIIAGPHWQDREKMVAKWMAETDAWNGVTHVKTEWDGTIAHALTLYDKSAGGRSDLVPVEDNWIAVTVDYHS